MKAVHPAAALITGVSRGLGLALAQQLLSMGSRVYALGRTAPDCLREQAGFRWAQADLEKTDSVGAACARLLSAGECPDLVILNAGVLGDLQALSLTPLSALRAVMNVNVWANKPLLDHLLAPPAPDQVIAISSGAAFNGSDGWGAYAISKSALNLLVRVYAAESPAVHMCALAPGLIETEMLRSASEDTASATFAAGMRIREARKEGRVQTPEQAARRLIQALPAIRRRPSGSFVDLRDFPGDGNG